jgi:rod shape-determining protein MreB and related proteins
VIFSSLIPTIYVQLSPERISVRNVKTGETVSEVPELAIDYEPKAIIVGFGNDARSHSRNSRVNIVNPFAHPRSLVSDFNVGEQLLKHFIARAQKKTIFAASPYVVVHPLIDPEGGFTQVEIRALREMTLGAGASRVVIWTGRALKDSELLSKTFPADGTQLI